jgi:transcriptional regulator with XRE-family HTH domain
MHVVKRNPTPDGEAIAAIREARNLTQQTLASLAGVSVASVQRAERGERMSPRNISALARALDASIPITRHDGQAAEITPGMVRAHESRVSDPPPAWAQEMLDELHALRCEVKECHRRMEQDAS